jgi:hypothetical protein
MVRDMRLIRGCIWILCALLLITSVDAKPDPPAVDPHLVSVKMTRPSGCAKGPCSLSGKASSPNFPELFHTQEAVFVADIVTDYPTSIIAETEQAADPSPPMAPAVRADASRS